MREVLPILFISLFNDVAHTLGVFRLGLLKHRGLSSLLSLLCLDGRSSHPGNILYELLNLERITIVIKDSLHDQSSLLLFVDLVLPSRFRMETRVQVIIDHALHAKRLELV